MVQPPGIEKMLRLGRSPVTRAPDSKASSSGELNRILLFRSEDADPVQLARRCIQSQICDTDPAFADEVRILSLGELELAHSGALAYGAWSRTGDAPGSRFISEVCKRSTCAPTGFATRVRTTARIMSSACVGACVLDGEPAASAMIRVREGQAVPCRPLPRACVQSSQGLGPPSSRSARSPRHVESRGAEPTFSGTPGSSTTRPPVPGAPGAQRRKGVRGKAGGQSGYQDRPLVSVRSRRRHRGSPVPGLARRPRRGVGAESSESAWTDQWTTSNPYPLIVPTNCCRISGVQFCQKWPLCSVVMKAPLPPRASVPPTTVEGFAPMLCASCS